MSRIWPTTVFVTGSITCGVVAGGVGLDDPDRGLPCRACAACRSPTRQSPATRGHPASSSACRRRGRSRRPTRATKDAAEAARPRASRHHELRDSLEVLARLFLRPRIRAGRQHLQAQRASAGRVAVHTPGVALSFHEEERLHLRAIHLEAQGSAAAAPDWAWAAGCVTRSAGSGAGDGASRCADSAAPRIA